MSDIAFIDTECRSAVPIQRGTDLYTRAAECTIVTWAVNREPVQCWDVFDEPQMPRDLREILVLDQMPLVAHQANFDRSILKYSLKKRIPVERWRCTRVQAYAHGLPGSLALLGLVLGLSEEHLKMDEGKALIQLFCIPREDGTFNSPYDYPEKWELFKRYAIRDTDSLREIYWRLPQHNYSGRNLDLYHLDLRVSERGFGLDLRLANAAIKFLEKAKVKTDAVMSEASGGVVTAATQRNRLFDYLTIKHGLDLPNLRAAEVREWLEHDDLDPEVRLLLETRLEAGKSSGSKYRRGVYLCGPGDRIRGAIQSNGAGRTGRYSGRGLQPHNMARPVVTVRRSNGKMELVPVKAEYIDEVIIPGIYSGAALDNDLVYGGPNEAAALALRHVIVAAPGNDLVVADWANIESRILAWIAGEEWKLAAYAAVDRGEGVDLYKLLFSQFFGVEVDDVNDNERQSGKVSELAFGFGGGVGALVTMAAAYQVELAPLAALVLPRASEAHLKKAYKNWRRAFLLGEDYGLEPKVYQACDVLKQTYRDSNSAIDQLKHDIDDATKGAIKTPGLSYSVGRCRIWSTGTWLIIELPSGRRLLYSNPRVEKESNVDVDSGRVVTREYISYATARGMTWRRERAWSGLFVENIVQAIANDVLRGALLRIDAATREIPAVAEFLRSLPDDAQSAISLHVHDEVVLDVPTGTITLEQMLAWMIEGFYWSEGLPLAAAGWIGPIYGKR